MMPAPVWEPLVAARLLARPEPEVCGPAGCTGAAARPEEAEPGDPPKPPLNTALPRRLPLPEPAVGSRLTALCSAGLLFKPVGGSQGGGAVREYVSALALRPSAGSASRGAEGRDLGGEGGANGKWFRNSAFPKKAY